MPARIKCPACEAVMQLDRKVTPGEEVPCPSCGKKLRLGVGGPPPKATPSDPANRPAPPRREDPPEEEPARPRGRKRKRGAKAKAGVPKWMIGVGVGGALSVVVLILILALSRGGGGGRSDGDLGSGDFVTIDAPVGEPVKADQASDALPPPAAASGLSSPALANAPADAPSAWKLPPDVPPPAEPLLAGLKLLNTTGDFTSGVNERRLPKFAALGGPFVLTFDGYEYRRFTSKEDRKTRKSYDEPIKLPPHRMIDLRTGKPAGEFSSLFQLTKPCFLGHDGKYVVSAEYRYEYRRPVDEKTESVPLYVWKQSAREPTATLKLPPHAGWLGFVAPNRFAALTFAPDAALQVWDVEGGKLEKTIPIPDGHLTADKVTNLFAEDGPRRSEGKPARVAVSPTGKYVAVSGKGGVRVFSVAEGKQVGVTPPGPGPVPYEHLGLEFTADGARLLALDLTSGLGDGAGLRVKEIDFAEGRVSRYLKVGANWYGATGTLMAGPGADTVMFTLDRGSPVVNLVDGSVISTLTPRPVRWAGAGQLLALVIEGRQQFVKLVNPDEAAPDKGGGTPMLSARPKVVAADRSAAPASKPQPPAAWAPLPARQPPERKADAFTLSAMPTAFGDAEAAEVRFAYQREPVPRHEMTWNRVNMKTGQAIGTVKLWPWAAPPSGRPVTTDPSAFPPAPPAALSADGKRLAVRDPADASRFDVWSEDGRRLFGLKPYDNHPVDWLGVSAGGRVLTRGAGKVTAWDANTGKAVFEIDGGYHGPTALAPGRAWLAACRADTIDLLDAETGRCLGRCKPNVAGGRADALAVSPDGQRLATARPAAAGPARKDARRAFLADVWSLADGRPTPAAFGAGKLELFQWTTPRHLLAVSGDRANSRVLPELIDAQLGVVTATYHNPMQKQNGLSEMPLFSAAPDGRVWSKGKLADWKPMALPDPERASDQAILAADLAVIDLTTSTIRVEVDLGTKERSREAGTKLAAALAQKGFTVGPGGLALRVSHEVRPESGGTLGDPNSGREVKLPKVAFAWRLLDGSGGEICRYAEDQRFLGRGSKFFVGSRTEAGGIGGMMYTEYNFQGNDVNKVVPEEILDRYAGAVALPGLMPLGKRLKSGASYLPLPVPIDLQKW